MYNSYLKVKEFHKKFNHPIRETPQLLSLDRVQKRYKLLLEEIK